jgi:hypothetical protein
LVEDPLDSLVGIVNAHYETHQTPLLLSRFGQKNGKLLAELKAQFGTLSAAVKEAGEDRLRIVDNRVGRESMAPAGVASEVVAKIQEQSANEKESSSSFDSLPPPVQIAFCVRTEAGEHIAVRVLPPFHYEKLSSLDLLRPGYRPLPDQFRRAGLELRHSSQHEREALWRSFVAWTHSQGLDPASFKHGKQTTALARLLAAQPADVVGRLVIPGDIAALLLKRP